MAPETCPRYPVKTRFKLAMECPTKLYYTAQPGFYADRKLEDEFQQALAVSKSARSPS